MTIRTLVRYARLAWSALGIGVAKESTRLGPSAVTPCIPAAKNCGASSSSGMANPLIGSDGGGMANHLIGSNGGGGMANNLIGSNGGGMRNERFR